MKRNRIGQRVRIAPEGGMREFWNKTGCIVSQEIDNLYRVKLDEPVTVPGVGEVRDDLWESRLLKRAR